MTKTKTIDTICDRPVPGAGTYEYLEDRGFMRDSQWIRSSLEGLSEEMLNRVVKDPEVLLARCPMTEHFLPDYDDWGDVSSELERQVTVPIKRVPRVRHTDPDNPPFHVFACSWFHLNIWGPLTREKFQRDLSGAVTRYAAAIDKEGVFRAYPITHIPPTVEGVAYHDWIGGAYPFDLRAVVTLDHCIDVGEVDGEPVVETGLKFHLVTLLGKDDFDAAARE